MIEKHLRIRTDKGQVAHMACHMYGGGYRTLCGRNVERVHIEPDWSLCWPCRREARRQGIEVKP